MILSRAIWLRFLSGDLLEIVDEAGEEGQSQMVEREGKVAEFKHDREF